MISGWCTAETEPVEAPSSTRTVSNAQTLVAKPAATVIRFSVDVAVRPTLDQGGDRQGGEHRCQGAEQQ